MGEACAKRSSMAAEEIIADYGTRKAVELLLIQRYLAEHRVSAAQS